MSTTNISRRRFLKSSAAVAAGVGITGVAPSFAAPSAGNQSNIKNQKALVFIMLDGGNDSYNMLVPYSQHHYAEYNKTRSNLALKHPKLLALDGFKDKDNRTFALHPSMPEVQDLFAKKKLSFISNIGLLVEPVTKESFKNNSAKLPLGLMSHSDQFKHWQSARPNERINQGWFGFMADSIQPNPKLNQIPMGISLAGRNIMQDGVGSTSYAITEKGSVGLVVKPSRRQSSDMRELNRIILKNFEALLNYKYDNDPFKQTYLSLTRKAQSLHEKFRDSIKSVRVPGRFSGSPLSQQLKMVAQSIKAADELGTPQQTFFIRYMGWDHHDELLDNQQRMLRVLSRGLGEFQASLDQMGLTEQVVTMTGSDFGRTLTSNGNGTDHGWGGNVMVMGGPVDGGKVFGRYPDLTLGSSNSLDVGNGVLIPTTSTDVAYAELAMWFGVQKNELGKLFPNLHKFHDLSSGSLPLGLIKQA
ncbi:DUF1501 domain-containing protein [Parashewanella curva]|uniref:DUF1501 domain-containing protein n=1 Tax=Parashewanella curva TaxID=2338552 RepID=A0A3L8Q120_9GAMM|nr:DUF1501 domain-containing protein [Parashewanella curva]RLV61150.1 DUF1501 domain-containing protein [Parashewanella curva]